MLLLFTLPGRGGRGGARKAEEAVAIEGEEAERGEGEMGLRVGTGGGLIERGETLLRSRTEEVRERKRKKKKRKVNNHEQRKPFQRENLLPRFCLRLPITAW